MRSQDVAVQATQPTQRDDDAPSVNNSAAERSKTDDVGALVWTASDCIEDIRDYLNHAEHKIDLAQHRLREMEQAVDQAWQALGRPTRYSDGYLRARGAANFEAKP